MRFTCKNHELDLYYSDSLFLPNATTRQFTKYARIDAGDVVVDLGTGVGPLAIWAAKEGARKVYGIDPVAQHCEYARANVKLHGLGDRIEIREGRLFEGLDGVEANAIIADVSGLADIPSWLLGWYPENIPTGGHDGTEVIIPAIEQSVRFLTNNGRFYFPVAVGLSDYEKTLRVADKFYQYIEEKAQTTYPVNPNDYEAVCRACGGMDFIKFSKKGSRIMWQVRYFEATQPNATSRGT